MKHKTSHVRTYHTSLKNLTSEQSTFLDNYATLFNHVQHNLFTDYAKGKSMAKLKPDYCLQHNLTSRQFNSVIYDLKGKISSIHELKAFHITELKTRITKAEKILKKIKSKFTIHHKKRRILNLKTKLMNLENNTKTRLCFGSQKLFKAQFHLKENNYTSHEHWRKDWKQSRKSQFYVIGSHDETSGNVSCTITPLCDDNFEFRLRLPNSFSEKYITFQAKFNYGSFTLLEALSHKIAISYRFVKDEKGWKIFVSVDKPYTEKVSKDYLGAIGVDININHLAVSELDRFGNLIKSHRIKLNTYGMDANQTSAAIGEASKLLLALATQSEKPIIFEKLDFKLKKSQLENSYKKYSRMLSSFAYAQIKANIKARAHDNGIEVHEINPAYTSVIGKHKFSVRYGITGHQAAAMVIGRRHMRFSERPNRRKSDHGTFLLPVRNRKKHVWSYWRDVNLGKVTHVALRELASPGLSIAPSNTCDESNLLYVGGIPTHESLPELFG